MSYLLSLTLPIVLTLCGVVPPLLIVFVMERRYSLDDKTTPLTKEMLRPPGFSLRGKLREMDEKFYENVVVSLLIPPACVITYVTVSREQSKLHSVMTAIVLVACAISVLVWASYQIRNTLAKRRNLQLGLEGEVFTGQELDQLMRLGCYVFHDVEFQYGNIDHVVVSPSGVFAVNTKIYCKVTTTANAKVCVDYNNKILKFPDRERGLPEDQLEAERRWLSQHLSKCTGQSINVESILALPGWFIDSRIGKGNITVINPINPGKWFVHKHHRYTPQQMEAIAYQLELLCRNVDRSFNKRKEWQID